MQARGTVRVIAPPICSIFTAPGRLDRSGDPCRFRVNEYYKETRQAAAAGQPTETILKQETHLEKCTRSEAEYVGGIGLTRCVCRVEEVQVIGVASWSQDMIHQEQQQYQQSLTITAPPARRTPPRILKLARH